MAQQKLVRAVLAHTNQQEQERLISILNATGRISVVCATGNGLDCIKAVEREKPELLIVDASLQVVDGLGVVSWVRKTDPEMKILMLSSDDLFVLQAQEKGVDSFGAMPWSSQAVVKSALALFDEKAKPVSDEEILREAKNLLIHVGGDIKLTGFEYCAYGTLILVRDWSLIHNLTKGLYPAIAEMADTNWKCVERNMRTFTGKLFTQSKLAGLEEIFGSKMTVTKDGVGMASSQFLGVLAHQVADRLNIPMEKSKFSDQFR